MDEGHQPVDEKEQKQMQQNAAIQQAEQDTGKVAAARTATRDPLESELDPRFDKVSRKQSYLPL